MRCPFLGECIYVVGEAFSSDQGWIEGALRTAESVLLTHFELTEPDWIERQAIVENMKYSSMTDYACG